MLLPMILGGLVSLFGGGIGNAAVTAAGEANREASNRALVSQLQGINHSTTLNAMLFDKSAENARINEAKWLQIGAYAMNKEVAADALKTNKTIAKNFADLLG